MSGNLEGRYIRLEVIGGENIQVPSERVPAGIYVSINVNSTQCWKSTTEVLTSDKSIVWDDTETVTLSSHESPELSVEIRASFEVDRMLGNGEVIGQFETPWKDLLDSGDETFDISFPPVRGVHPSLTLKAVIVHVSGNQDGALFDSIVECQIARHADAGHARFATYVINRTVSHLVDAVEHFQLVLDRCSVGHPDRAAALTNLAYSRLEGYRLKHLQDINSTTAFLREALALRPQDHPDHFLSIYHFTRALTYCPNKKNTSTDIHQAQPTGENDIDHVLSAYNNLPIDNSDEGIYLCRMVLELCPLANERHPELLDKLVWALRTRFDHQGNLDDLNEAISLYEEALRLRPVGHESRHFLLDNLGATLLIRFKHRGDVNSIMRAISLRREALTLCLPGNPYRDTILENLAFALQTRYEILYTSEDLDEAINLYRDSLQFKPYDHPHHHAALCNLSWALCSRFTQSRKNEDVEEAIRLCQESLEALPSLHPDRYFSYTQLENAYMSRYRVQHNLADLSLAVENFGLASRHPTYDFPNRIVTAQRWVAVAEQHGHKSALDAYITCFDLLDGYLTTRSSTISRREAATAFRGVQSLPVDAASYAIRCDDLRQAIELVEQGRGQQWSLASRLRTPLEELKSASRKLAHQLSEITQRLSDAQGSAGSADRVALDQAETRYRRLQRQWEAVVAEIRNVKGFSRFLLPPLYEHLQAAARHGPVIILIASEKLCSAIIVPTSGELCHVSFPSITLTHLKKLKSDFAREIRHASFMRPEETRKELQVLLRTVWDEIMLPIVIILQRDLRLTSGSRIWLCPTATFTYIPLHAAHPFRTKADGRHELCLEDVYICSYTPTLSALIRSRQMMKKRAAPSFVAIGQSSPGAGQGEALLTVDSELELVRKLVPVTANPTTLSGDDATRAGALNALRHKTWVHLACHGKQDREQPYYSRFAMRDKPLTLLDIMKKDIPHAEFAFLSACHTAVGDEKTPDEVIHLAAGLQFSGFKSVIGTLWVVNDAVANHVVEAFYKNLVKGLKDGNMMDCTKAAWALNRATYSVKTKVPLEQRIAFVHIGV